jgi:hypothetical protein
VWTGAVEKDMLLELGYHQHHIDGGNYFDSMSLSQNVRCEHEVRNELNYGCKANEAG